MSAPAAAPAAQPAPAANNDDYLDKGLAQAQAKYGGGKIDPVKAKKINEKITDGFRGWVEKTFGFKIPKKVSN
ncbi:MAG: hypothetical protein M1825_004920 [Sarcosagium campestre]|nr:MAG: hypothetical protein M1825_004920 [Sarcosagium campestre]